MARPARVSVSRALPAVAVIAIAGLALVNLTTFPATWFDEGSHLHVPKTLVTRGVYADYSSEGFRYFGPSIGIGPTVMLPVAVSLKLFGAGLMQARLVAVVYLLIAVVAFFRLANLFGGARLAWLATAILAGSHAIGLIESGRQVLGEVPAFAFVALGWLVWLRAESDMKLRKLLAAGALFGLSAVTKNQNALLLLPGLLVAGLANRIYYRRLPHRYFAIPLLVTAGVYAAWQAVALAFLGPGTLSENLALFGQFSSSAAFVRSIDLRERGISLLLGADVFAGWIVPVLIYGVVLALRRNAGGQRWGNVMVLILGGLGWYVFASISWLRYAFLPLALAALVAARLVDDLIGHADLRPRRWWAAVQQGDRRAAIAPVALGAFVFMSLVPLALTTWHILHPPAPDAQALAEYLNANIAQDALIETWEPELGFLTDHTYHFPPHALLDTAVRYMWLGGPPPASQYDFRAGSPDYVIAGPFAKYTGLYAPDALAPDYRLSRSFGAYDIYARAP